MIISASRRTDIPGFYSEWLLQRLKEGRVLVPNPWNPRRLGSIRLSPDHVDCIVFWTKNAAPMMEKLDAVDALGYRYYFSFTVTPYGPDVERHLPPKVRIMETFRRLSERLGPERVDWRFDPVVVDGGHSLQWHLDRFGEMCGRLSGFTGRCIVNFIKSYPHLADRVREMETPLIRQTARGLAKIAAEYRLPLYNCTEKWNLRDLGIEFGACIDRGKIERLLGGAVRARKDPGQPKICRCLESVDIGMYNTCGHGCGYCYAVTGDEKLRRRMAEHDPASPMLTGRPDGTETVTDRTGPSLRDRQGRLF